MTSGRDWLYQRLRSEPVCDNGHDRWNSIVSRLLPLTAVDQSTKRSGQDELKSPKLETAQDNRDKFIFRAGGQGEGRGRAKTIRLKQLFEEMWELYEKQGRNQKS
jgi:hypothetical protein